jgi:hypothetical protein
MGRAPGTGKTTGKNNKIGVASHLEAELVTSGKKRDISTHYADSHAFCG